MQNNSINLFLNLALVLFSLNVRPYQEPQFGPCHLGMRFGSVVGVQFF